MCLPDAAAAPRRSPRNAAVIYNFTRIRQPGLELTKRVCGTNGAIKGFVGVTGGIVMRDKIALIERRRDGIQEWLEDEAPHTAVDQKHLELASPERAYWHHGYQAALNDVIGLLGPVSRKSGSADIPN
jgi:hypothetical protein